MAILEEISSSAIISAPKISAAVGPKPKLPEFGISIITSTAMRAP